MRCFVDENTYIDLLPKELDFGYYKIAILCDKDTDDYNFEYYPRSRELHINSSFNVCKAVNSIFLGTISNLISRIKIPNLDRDIAYNISAEFWTIIRDNPVLLDFVIPDTIRMYGIDYSVSTLGILSNPSFIGEIDYNLFEINLLKYEDSAQQYLTLIHEIAHAIEHHLSLELGDLTETFACGFAYAIVQLFKFNNMNWLYL